MAEAGTSSTPAAADPAATPAAPSTPTPAADPAKPAAAATGSPATPDPAKPAEAKPAEYVRTFKLPKDMKISDEAQASFDEFMKAGKLGQQDIVDHFAAQARLANTAWQAQQKAQNDAWEAECKTRFNAAQLAAAETGVGFLSSFDPQFRDIAQQFKNHPSFVNAMRVVGERLSEDTFEGGGRPPTAPKKSAASIMYPSHAKGNGSAS